MPARAPIPASPGHRPLRWPLLPLLGLAALLPPRHAAAQTAEPAPLTVARASFLRQILTDSQLLTEQYERALAKVEQDLAAAADYEEARLVQQRRAELKALYPATDAELAQTLAQPLDPAQAHLSGSAEARGNQLTGWRTAGSAAEWSNLRIAPGRYYLEMEANLTELPTLPGSFVAGRSQPQERAGFDFFEVSLLPDAAENRRSFEISLSQDEETYEPVRVGPVNFTRSPVTLRLAATAGYPGNLVRLRGLRLVPATVEAPTVSSPPPAGPTLADLKKALADDLSQAQKPLLEAYLAEIRTLASQTPALADSVQAETKRLMRLLETSRNANATPMRLLASSGSLNGFEDLDGAQWVAAPDNQGDRFWVEHEGRRLNLRLLWVQCAPPTEAASPARRSFAKHFGLSEADVPALGRAAQEFTAGYLEGKPLRLLIQPGKAKDGSQGALVFLPDVGLFQNILVAQGLAAVTPAKERRGMMEAGLIESLIEREQTARRQKPAPGAWSLAEESTR